jgi:hypothetical protein
LKEIFDEFPVAIKLKTFGDISWNRNGGSTELIFEPIIIGNALIFGQTDDYSRQ